MPAFFPLSPLCYPSGTHPSHMSTPRRYTRAERLKSRKRIEALFQSGKSFNAFPLKVFYHWEGDGATLIGFGAPKRNFKRAVDRNRIKRLLREAWRLQQEPLPGLQAFIIFTGKDLPTQAEMMTRIGVILRKLHGLRPGAGTA